MYKKHRIHFVGIGGVGMSGIAEVLINLGYPVSGSDVKRGNLTRRLKKRGALLRYGHRAENIGDAEVLVASSAIRPDNPELLEAKKRRLIIIQRAEMLSELMRFSRYGVAVSGTHGKTTTTSLVASVLYAGGLDPTVIIGGRVNSLRSNARLGRGQFMVAEADESDGSFLKLSPTIAIITNIDREHMDYYKDFNSVRKAYLEFANKIPFYGAVVVCVDHPVVAQMIPEIDKRVVTYGFSEEAKFKAGEVMFKMGQMIFNLYIEKKLVGPITLNLSGRHNVLNALASLAVAYELEIPLKKAASSLARFKGIERRCQILLNQPTLTVIDDYGHHPEEIKATLKTIREAYPQRRVVCFFQPHRYSRTRDLFDELIQAFDEAHLVFITDIYAAGEAPIPEIHAKKIVSALAEKRGNTAVYLPRTRRIVDEMLKIIQPGDILLTLGAGDITHWGKECARRLKSYAKLAK